MNFVQKKSAQRRIDKHSQSIIKHVYKLRIRVAKKKKEEEMLSEDAGKLSNFNVSERQKGNLHHGFQ